MKVGVKNILMRTKSKECIILIEGLVSKMLVIKKGGNQVWEKMIHMVNQGQLNRPIGMILVILLTCKKCVV